MILTQNSSCIPISVKGAIQDIKITDEILYWWPWIENYKNKKTYLMLASPWKNQNSYPDHPPPGYDYYITHGDSYMFGWPEHLSKYVQGTIIHLTGPIMPDSFDTDRIKYVSYNNTHLRIAKLPRINCPPKTIKFKASALTNRISQSKAIVFAALMHYLARTDCVVSLRTGNFNEKNVHAWHSTGNAVCDYWMENFKNHWNNKEILLANDDGVSTSYNNSAYQCSALNFTQESYHYSFTMENNKSYIQPGPFITEKTWKVLVSATAFIPVGQCYTYRWLKSLGLKFDYGSLDLGFDDDPGNLTRLEKIVNLIKSLKQWSAQDLYEMTLESSLHNQEYVNSSAFWNTCEKTNESVNKLLESL